MNMAAYLKSTGKTVSEVARELECSRGHVNDMAKGRRKPGKKIAAKLEAISGHAWWKWMGRA